MKLVIAIFGLLSNLYAQVIQLPIPSNSGSVSSNGTGASITFPQLQPENCSHRSARWEHLVGTFVIGDGKERKIVREAWIKVDPCQRQDIAAVLCPRTEIAATAYESFKSEIHFVAANQSGIDADGIAPKCGINRRIKWRVYEW